MIYTVTFNPSLDYVMFVGALERGAVNRASREQLYPGSKGINVSIMLSRLGMETTALGFTAGFTGDVLRKMLGGSIAADFIELPAGRTRINVKIMSGEETGINGKGPDIPEACIETLFKKLDSLSAGDTLVLAGSIPSSLPHDIYENILTRLSGRGIDFVVDATKELLKSSLSHRPFLIKPNMEELGEMLGVTIRRREELRRCAKAARDMGARNVLVSMDEAGALLVTEEGDLIEGVAPEGNLVNSVGAGDSMVAGFLAGYRRTRSYTKALTLGLAAGSATAFSEWLAERESVKSLLEHPEEFGF